MLDLCWKTMNSQFFVFINDSIFMNEICMRLDDYNLQRSLICTKLYSGIPNTDCSKHHNRLK